MPLYLRGAVPDALNAGVPPQALDRHFFHQAHTAEDLYGVVCHPADHFRGEQFRHSGIIVLHLATIGALAGGFADPVRYFADQDAAVDYYKGET